MKCPHCHVRIHTDLDQKVIIDTNKLCWRCATQICPACGNAIIYLNGFNKTTSITTPPFLAYPATGARPVSADVPEDFANEYREACVVMAKSPKASAALSRRSLQRLLRENAGVKPQNLSKEIDEVLAAKQLPSYLADSIDAVRNIGNFAAHPIKSTNTGEIVDVEPGEAEWLLDVLEGLFDFYFVQPAVLQRKRDALNQKLAEAGKPPMK